MRVSFQNSLDPTLIEIKPYDNRDPAGAEKPLGRRRGVVMIRAPARHPHTAEATSMTELHLDQLLAQSRLLALEAGREIMRLYEAGVSVEKKADNTPVTEADHAAEAIILPGLARLAPDIPIISEEAVTADGVPSVSGNLFWLVDPLDGTREFLARNGEFTVNIALVRNGQPILGVVHAPAMDATYMAAGPGTGLMEAKESGLSGLVARRPPDAGLTVCVSRSHANRPALADHLADVTVAETITAGSSIKFCLIAAGTADLYPRLGTTMAWDTAAGHAVLAAAGGHVRTLEGDELIYDPTRLKNPNFRATGADA
jgi:3'(2'), 5'-bisphosphate nucleotidase